MYEDKNEYHMPAIRSFSRGFNHNDEFPGRKVRRMDYKNNLNRKRTYMKTPDDWYSFRAPEGRNSISPYENQGVFLRTLHIPHVQRTRHHGYKLKYDNMFNKTSNSPKPIGPRKGMIIGERKESEWKVTEPRRQELPGNLFIDNLRHQDIDWNAYRNVTWKDILTSYRKDDGVKRDHVQSLRQKEEWLSRLEDQVEYTRNDFDTTVPYVSPRLFHPAAVARRQRAVGNYQTKDGMGTIYTLVGPEDYSKKDYKPVVFQAEPRDVVTPRKLNF